MPRYLKSVFASALFIVILSTPLITLLGASLQLTKIGSLDLGGKMYSEWWYTGTFPTFFGTAQEDSEVTIKLNDNSYTATANSSGDWSYPSGLPAGDHSVVISQGGSQIAFTLHLGQSVPSNLGGTSASSTTESTTVVPSTGIDQIAAILFGSGIILLAAYFYFWGDISRQTAFEQKIIKD